MSFFILLHSKDIGLEQHFKVITDLFPIHSSRSESGKVDSGLKNLHEVLAAWISELQ